MGEDVHQVVDDNLRLLRRVACTDNGCFRDGYIVANLNVCDVNYHSRTNSVSFTDAYTMTRDRCKESNLCVVTNAELFFAHNDRADMHLDVTAYVIALQSVYELFDTSGQETKSEHFCNWKSINHGMLFFFNDSEALIVVHQWDFLDDRNTYRYAELLVPEVDDVVFDIGSVLVIDY